MVGVGDKPSQAVFNIILRNRHVAADWETLRQNRPELCERCWDHLRTAPRTTIGTRYVPLRGSQKHVTFRDQILPQWQYEIDSRARVKVGIGEDFVVIISVSTGHPKENE